MARIEITVGVKMTPALHVMIEMVPDHLSHELEPVLERLNGKWRRMRNLIECGRGRRHG